MRPHAVCPRSRFLMVSEWHTIFHSLSFMVLFGEIFLFPFFFPSLLLPSQSPPVDEPELRSSRPEVISSVLITTRICRNSRRCFLRSLDNCSHEMVSVVAHVASNSCRVKRTSVPHWFCVMLCEPAGVLSTWSPSPAGFAQSNHRLELLFRSMASIFGGWVTFGV